MPFDSKSQQKWYFATGQTYWDNKPHSYRLVKPSTKKKGEMREWRVIGEGFTKFLLGKNEGDILNQLIEQGIGHGDQTPALKKAKRLPPERDRGPAEEVTVEEIVSVPISEKIADKISKGFMDALDGKPVEWVIDKIADKLRGHEQLEDPVPIATMGKMMFDTGIDLLKQKLAMKSKEYNPEGTYGPGMDDVDRAIKKVYEPKYSQAIAIPKMPWSKIYHDMLDGGVNTTVASKAADRLSESRASEFNEGEYDDIPLDSDEYEVLKGGLRDPEISVMKHGSSERAALMLVNKGLLKYGQQNIPSPHHARFRFTALGRKVAKSLESRASEDDFTTYDKKGKVIAKYGAPDTSHMSEDEILDMMTKPGRKEEAKKLLRQMRDLESRATENIDDELWELIEYAGDPNEITIGDYFRVTDEEGYERSDAQKSWNYNHKSMVEDALRRRKKYPVKESRASEYTREELLDEIKQIKKDLSGGPGSHLHSQPGCVNL